MAENINTCKSNEYFISFNTTSVDECNVALIAWPSSVGNPNFKVGYRTSWNNAANGREDYQLFSHVLENELKYDELDTDTKTLVDKYISNNYLKVENNIIKVIPPVISKNNLLKLYNFIKNDTTLQNAFNEYSKNVYKEVEKLFPSYLHNQLEFIVS